MEQEYTTITRQIIKKASPKKGLIKQQFIYLGLGWPLKKGWGDKLLSSKIKTADLEFLFQIKYMSKQKLKTVEITPIELVYTPRKLRTVKPKKQTTKKSKYRKVTSNGYINELLNFVYVNYPIEWEKQYYHPNWQRMRLFILNRDNFKCQKCGDEHTQLHVHHKHYSDGFIWEVDPTYLITLCDKCHSKEHKKNKS
ncbi:HNH endonuclease [Candidatus Pacearchaeota archaeon]|nr:HNH endonuclease [Candidatus Pacearchaeota archaeon]